MTKKTFKKYSFMVIVVYCIAVVITYFAGGEEFYYKYESTQMLSPATTLGELLAGDNVEQKFICEGDELIGISVKIATFARENNGLLKFSILEDGQEIYNKVISSESLSDNSNITLNLNKPVANVKDKELILKIQALDGEPGNAITLYIGNSISLGKADVAQTIQENQKAVYNGQPLEYSLCMEVMTRTRLIFGQIYWQIASVLGIVILLYMAILYNKLINNKKSLSINLLIAMKKYHFLLTQLVARDFKTKYKRSVLGVLWSFLNPLFMMMVQYIVFSTLFKSSIPNFAAYLLIGIVCYNFFSEAAAMCLMSIVGNATLITKVYVPKYIYPISKICSSCINLLLSMIPLILVLLITKTDITMAWTLIPFGVICLIGLSTGIGMVLSASMVFFRDTQFLWGVVSLLWMYFTPIFYPESIIPNEFLTLYKMNPLYHIIRFLRIILIDGVSPEPKAYIFCLIASIIPLIIGAWIFKKTQDRFILNI